MWGATVSPLALGNYQSHPCSRHKGTIPIHFIARSPKQLKPITAESRKRSRLGARVCGVFLASLLAITSWSPPAAADSYVDTAFVSELVVTAPALSTSGMAWAPDGRMFIWQKNGIVRVFKNGSLLSTPFLDFSS